MIFSCGKTFKSSRIRNLCLVDENQKNSHNTTALITLHNRLTRHVWFGVSLAQNVKNGKKNLEFQKEILCKIPKLLLNALFSIINFIYDSTMRSFFFNPTVVESCFLFVENATFVLMTRERVHREFVPRVRLPSANWLDNVLTVAWNWENKELLNK